jgi:hypothetical protein
VRPVANNASFVSLDINEESVEPSPSYLSVQQEKESPNYAEIDESGYVSSGSSIYEVGSDDDNYNDFNENFNVFGLDNTIVPSSGFSNRSKTKCLFPSETGTTNILANQEIIPDSQEQSAVLELGSEPPEVQPNCSYIEAAQVVIGNQCCSEAGKEIPAEGETEQCECLNGNPFLHVMTKLNEGNADSTPWKKSVG